MKSAPMMAPLIAGPTVNTFSLVTSMMGTDLNLAEPYILENKILVKQEQQMRQFASLKFVILTGRQLGNQMNNSTLSWPQLCLFLALPLSVSFF